MPYKKLFNDGYDDGTDNMFPEEWVASKVKAINPKYFGGIGLPSYQTKRRYGPGSQP